MHLFPGKMGVTNWMFMQHIKGIFTSRPSVTGKTCEQRRKHMISALISHRNKSILLLVTILLSSCISIDVESTVSPQPDFVTATLPPMTAYPTVTITEPTSSPAATVASSATSTLIPTSIHTAKPDCQYAAILLRDVTVPDFSQMQAGETFIKTWEFQNVGTCPWTNYTLRFSSGDEMHAPLSTPVADTAPKATVQVSMQLTAPTADGRYSGYFTLNNANGDVIPIGTEKTFWVKFMVGTYATIPTSLPPSGNCTSGGNADYASQIVSLINAARTDAGMNTLTVNAELSAFAQHHAEDMAYNNFLSHDGSDGAFGPRMMNYSLSHIGQQITGEILAIGTPQNAMDQWRRDEHWNYVLGVFTQIGVGYAYNSCSDYGGYFTVDLSEK
jgi:uncharacterized protein YkwD